MLQSAHSRASGVDLGNLPLKGGGRRLQAAGWGSTTRHFRFKRTPPRRASRVVPPLSGEGGREHYHLTATKTASATSACATYARTANRQSRGLPRAGGNCGR